MNKKRIALIWFLAIWSTGSILYVSRHCEPIQLSGGQPTMKEILGVLSSPRMPEVRELIEEIKESKGFFSEGELIKFIVDSEKNGELSAAEAHLVVLLTEVLQPESYKKGNFWGQACRSTLHLTQTRFGVFGFSAGHEDVSRMFLYVFPAILISIPLWFTFGGSVPESPAASSHSPPPPDGPHSSTV